MYPYVYGYGYEMFNYGGVVAIGALVAAILAIVLFFTFMNRKNEGKFTGAKGKIYDFLNFNKFYVEDVLRLIYVVSAAVITVVGVLLLFVSFLTGLILITLGNVLLRVAYELMMMFIIMCRKTVSIDRRLAMMEGSTGGGDGCGQKQAETEAAETKQAEAEAKAAVSAEPEKAAPTEAVEPEKAAPTEADEPDGEDEEIISQVYGAEEKNE